MAIDRMRSPTDEVLIEVADERLRQDDKWGGQANDDSHSTAEFVQLIEDYAGWARTMAGMNSPAKARERLIQVAALAVAAVESIDRKNMLFDLGVASKPGFLAGAYWVTNKEIINAIKSKMNRNNQ